MAPNPRPGSKLTQPLYDSFSYAAAGQQKATLFAQGLGAGTTAFGGAGAKTTADTNIPANGEIPKRWKQVVKAISVVGWGTAATQIADLQLGLAAAVFFLKIASVDWLQLPAKKMTGGCGIDGFAAATDRIGHNGIAAPSAVFVLEDWIEIEGGQQITCTMEWPNGVQAVTAAFPVTVFLEGTQYREH